MLNICQYLLEDAASTNQTVRMICCQPRRLTAVTVAERIAAERGEKVMNEFSMTAVIKMWRL